MSSEMYQNKVFNHPSTTPSHPLGYKTRKSTQTACCHDINSNCVNRISEMDDVWMNLIISPPYLFLINLNQFDSSIFRTLIIYNLRFIVLFFILDSGIYEHFFNFIQGCDVIHVSMWYLGYMGL